MKALQSRGVLSSIKITSSLRHLLREEVCGLLRQVEELPQTPAGKSVLPIKEFCRDKGVPLARLIEQWKQGDLDGKVCKGDGDGLQAIEVDWDAFRGSITTLFDRDLELPETTGYLKISIASVRHLRDHGFLTQTRRRNPDTNHVKSCIT